MHKKTTKLLPFRRHVQQPKLVLGYVAHHEPSAQPDATLVALHDHGDLWHVLSVWQFTGATWEQLSHSSQSPEERDSSALTLKKLVGSAPLSALLPYASFPLGLPADANDADLAQLVSMKLAQRGVQHCQWTVAGTAASSDVYVLQQNDSDVFYSRLAATLPQLPRLAFLSACQFVAKDRTLQDAINIELIPLAPEQLSQWGAARPEIEKPLLTAIWIALQGLEHC